MLRDRFASSARISFTAHYTGYVWHRHHWSPKGFDTSVGHLAYLGLAPVNRLTRQLYGFDLETLLLQRHALIDHLLTGIAEAAGPIQVLELAAGLSPRGYRLLQSPQLDIRQYVEVDLPEMAARKRRLIDRFPGRHPRILTADLFPQGGGNPLERLSLEQFDSNLPLVCISEGLINYFDLDAVQRLWRQIAALTSSFPRVDYLSDLFEQPSNRPGHSLMTLGRRLLSLAVRGRVHLHFENDEQAQSALLANGFGRAALLDPAAVGPIAQMPTSDAPSLVRVIHAQA